MKKAGLFLLILVIILFSLYLISAQEYTLKVTEEHPFFLNGEWVVAKDLKVGDFLITDDGKKAKITNIEEVADNIEVYNLEAEPFNDFVVAGDVIVHNSASPTCFAAGTKIAMADGSKKNIENIKVGDKILSWDFSKNKKIEGEVIGLWNGMHDDIYIINEKIKVTAEHPFWTKEEGWASINPKETLEKHGMNIGKLNAGYHFMDEKGNSVEIKSIVSDFGEIMTYNLRIKNYENYYANDVLVHNKPNEAQKGNYMPLGTGKITVIHSLGNRLYLPLEFCAEKGIGRGDTVTILIPKISNRDVIIVKGELTLADMVGDYEGYFPAIKTVKDAVTIQTGKYYLEISPEELTYLRELFKITGSFENKLDFLNNGRNIYIVPKTPLPSDPKLLGYARTSLSEIPCSIQGNYPERLAIPMKVLDKLGLRDGDWISLILEEQWPFPEQGKYGTDVWLVKGKIKSESVPEGWENAPIHAQIRYNSMGRRFSIFIEPNDINFLNYYYYWEGRILGFYDIEGKIFIRPTIASKYCRPYVLSPEGILYRNNQLVIPNRVISRWRDLFGRVQEGDKVLILFPEEGSETYLSPVILRLPLRTNSDLADIYSSYGRQFVGTLRFNPSKRTFYIDFDINSLNLGYDLGWNNNKLDFIQEYRDIYIRPRCCEKK
jgi:hypothetical protein